MIDAADLFLVEEFPAEEQPRPAVPAGMAGALVWREYPQHGRWYWRTGVVIALAPADRSVWVLPTDPRPGEGRFVVVCNVTEQRRHAAERRVGVGNDYLSTEQWQRPHALLPRAVIRLDRREDGRDWLPSRLLHADRRCPHPGNPFGEVKRGRARRVESCYVFRGHLHPLSRRPVDPGRRRQDNPYAQVCGVCLKDGRP